MEHEQKRYDWLRAAKRRAEKWIGMMDSNFEPHPSSDDDITPFVLGLKVRWIDVL
jgi:hypothetical protein